MAGSWFDPVPVRIPTGTRSSVPTAAPPPPPSAMEEPTQPLPVVPPRVGARTVIVYERRSLGLLVALTAGVILGQTMAFQPHSSAAVAVAGEIAPSASTPPATPPPTGTGPSVARVSAPLGRTAAETFEVSGDATLVSVVTADLGDRLYDIAGLDDSAVPAITATASGRMLTFVRTGAPGRVGATVQLNQKVRWTLRFTGRTTEQSLDLRTGKLVALDLAGTTTRATLRLPDPTGTVPLRLTGSTGTLNVLARDGVPVRLKLGQGAGTAIVDDRTRTNLKATTITPTGWFRTTNRYDLSTTQKITSVRVTRA